MTAGGRQQANNERTPLLSDASNGLADSTGERRSSAENGGVTATTGPQDHTATKADRDDLSDPQQLPTSVRNLILVATWLGVFLGQLLQPCDGRREWMS
jgi:hypothetical protein